MNVLVMTVGHLDGPGGMFAHCQDTYPMLIENHEIVVSMHETSDC
jgi:hypothetical protein